MDGIVDAFQRVLGSLQQHAETCRDGGLASTVCALEAAIDALTICVSSSPQLEVQEPSPKDHSGEHDTLPLSCTSFRGTKASRPQPDRKNSGGVRSNSTVSFRSDTASSGAAVPRILSVGKLQVENSGSDVHSLSPQFSLGAAPSGDGFSPVAFRTPFHRTSALEKGQSIDGLKTINQYTVIDELGRGAYGKVKLAIRNDNHNEVRAIKILRKSLLRRVTTGAGLSAFQLAQKEVALMKKMNHPHIAHLFEVIDDPDADKMYLVMQFIDGGPIAPLKPSSSNRLLHGPSSAAYTPVPVALAFKYVRQIASALVYMHRHGVVHRDLKPDNILLHYKGRDEAQAMLVDFGVSTRDDAELLPAGTPAFFSPEVCRDGRAHDGPTQDMWALGVTLYIMLFGHYPFAGRTAAEVMASIAQVETVAIPDVADSGDVEGGEDGANKYRVAFFEAVLPELLSRDPKQRMTAPDLYAMTSTVLAAESGSTDSFPDNRFCESAETNNFCVDLGWSDMDGAILSNYATDGSPRVHSSFYSAATAVQFAVRVKSMADVHRRASGAHEAVPTMNHE